MAFSLSSNVITQTGTDTDLSGLSSITGVTTTTIAGSGTTPYFKVYDIGNLRLVINGTVTHDASKESLVIRGNNANNTRMTISSGAIYNYGVDTTFQGGTHYSKGEGIIIRAYYSGSMRQYNESYAGILIEGDFNWKGGTIVSGRSVIVTGNGTITAREGVFKPWSTSLTTKNYCPRIGFNGADVDVDGLEVYGHDGHFFGFALQSQALTNFTNIKIQGTTDYATAIAGDLLNNANSSAPHAQIKNVPSLASGNLYSGRAWQNRVNTWTNYGGGVNLKDELSDTNSNLNAATGIVIAQKEVAPTVVDTAGSAVQDIKILIKEESDGNEATSAQLGNYSATDITHYSSARSQILTTDASGQIGTITTGLFLGHKINSGSSMTKNVKTLSGTNEQTCRQFGYDYILNDGRINVSGTGALQPTFTMIQDINVTATKAVADAYTELNTAPQIYDRAKSYLYDNWAGENALIVARSGNQVDIGSKNLNIDGTATSAFAYSTDVTIKSSTFTGGVTGTGTVTVSNGVSLNGGTFDSPVVYSVGASTITNVTADSIDFTQAGTYNLVRTSIGTVTNSSGGNITLVLDANSSVTTNTGPNITLQAPQTEINFTNLEAGSQLVVYTAGTTTELFRVNSTSTSEQYINANASVSYDYTVQKAGKFPIRATGLTATNVSASTNIISQVTDRAYVASSNLNNTNVTIDTVARTIDSTQATTVQNLYSYLIEAFIAESSLRNIAFPMTTFGSSSFSLDLDFEFTSSTISLLSRDGFRYTNGTTIKAEYVAILSQGVTAGLQPEYVQTQGGTVVDTNNTGNVDQVIQVFDNGVYDYRNHLVFKVQANTYRQAEFDVINTYGTLEPTLYVISLNTNSIDGLTSGDPSITGVTLTDNTSAPVAWNAGDGVKNYSLTITDTGANSGEDILRHFNYLLSTDGTLNGLDVFQYPEMILDNGAAYETLKGIFRKSSGDVTVGIRVIDGSGNPHPDFTRFQSDDGSYGTVPIVSSASISGLVANSRIQIYNVTTATEIVNTVNAGTGYTATYNNGTGYSVGDTVRVRATYVSGTNAKLGWTATTQVGQSGWAVVADQKDDEVYNQIGVDGSTITIFDADYVDTEIDLIVSTNFGSAELYPWWVNNLYSSDGIKYFFGGIIAEDIANFKIDANTVDLMFDTDVNSNVYQNNDARIYRSDGIYPVKAPTTGGGAIDLVWRQRVFVAEVGTSGLTATESATLAKIDTIDKNTKLIPATL